MTFQLICLIIGNLLISVLLLKGLHPILSVLAGVSVMIWTNGLPYFETFTAGLTSWGGAMMPTIYLTLLGGSLGVIYTKTGAITSMAKVLLIPSQKVNSDAAKICLCIIGFVFFRVLLGLAGFVNEAIIVTMMCMCGVIFKTADVPRRHLPALTAFAASLGTVMPGAPTMINTFLSLNFPEEYSSTAYMGGRIVLWVIFIALFLVFMTAWILRDKKKGNHFEQGNMLLPEFEEGKKEPNFLLALVPILIIFVFYNFLGFDSWAAVAMGVIAAAVAFWGYVPVEGDAKTKFGSVLNFMGEGVMLIPIQLMLMVLPVMIMSQAPAFEWGVNLLNNAGFSMTVALAILTLIFMFFGGLGTVPALCPVFASVYAPAGVSLYAFTMFVTWGVAFSGGLPTNASISVESNLADCKVGQTYPSIFIGSICTATIVYILAILASLAGFFG